jgi:hypothetical protein
MEYESGKGSGSIMKSRDWGQFGAGAAFAAIAVVALYEGKIYLANGADGTTRGVASPARLREAPDSRFDRIESPLRRSPDGAPGGATPSATDKAMAARVANQLGGVRGKLAEVQREKGDLEARLRNLETELAERTGSPQGEAHEFELDREDWKELAAESRIKYRIPCSLPSGGSYAIPRDELDELGLSPDDGKTLLEAHRRSNDRVWATLRPLCSEAVGDDAVVDLLGRSHCLGVIERTASKSDAATAGDARRHVAEAHAGVRTAEAAPTPLFEALMALTNEAQDFEADLAENFGPEEAKRIVRSMRCVDTTR